MLCGHSSGHRDWDLDVRFTSGLYSITSLLVPVMVSLFWQQEVTIPSGGWTWLQIRSFIILFSKGMEIRISLLFVNCWCWVCKLQWKWMELRRKRTGILQMGLPFSFFWCFFKRQIKMWPQCSPNNAPFSQKSVCHCFSIISPLLFVRSLLYFPAFKVRILKIELLIRE